MIKIIDPRIANTNVHKVGVYRVGDREYFNKLEAFQDSIRSGQEVTWHIFEEELAATDLTKEPDEDIHALYIKRAQQLRNDYDHLVLHFSGGDDSTNIVQTFIRAGIKIDQIFIRYHAGSVKTARSEFEKRNVEIDTECLEPFNLAAVVAKEIKDYHWPDVEVTMCDLTDPLLKMISDDPNWYEKRHSASIDPAAFLRSDYDLMHPPWRTMAEKGKRIAHILGKEKPFVSRDEKGFYMQYNDTNHQDHVIPRMTEVGLPQYVELFYWDPSTIQMQLKQAHMLRRAWQEGDPILTRTEELKSGRAHEDAMARILYGYRFLSRPMQTLKIKDVPGLTLTNSTPWKVVSDWSLRDKSSIFFKNWSRGTFELYKTVKPLYTHSMSFWHSGFPTLSSPKHYIWYHNEEESGNDRWE